MTPRRPVPNRRAPRLAVATLAAACASSSWAATPAATPATPEAVAEQALGEALAPLVASRGVDVKIVVVPSDARRALAPCGHAVGTLPPGARTIGRTTVGVRCIDGANWQTFVGADVRLEAPAWKTSRPLRAGETVQAADVVEARVALVASDLDAKTRDLAVLDPKVASPVGRLLQRSVAAGRPLAPADLKDAGRVNPGEPVRIVYRGTGFSVSSEGQAVGAADPGGDLLIRLATGTVVRGTLRGDRQVELPQ